MCREVVASRVAVDPDVRRQSYNVASPGLDRSRCVSGTINLIALIASLSHVNGWHSPQVFPLVVEQCLLEPRLKPQAVCKSLILHLEAIVHPDCVSSFGLAGSGRQRERAQEGDVVPTQ